jgi:hypothetical protein
LSTHLRLGLPSGLFPSGIPTNILYQFIFSPFVLHALPISHYYAYVWKLEMRKSNISRWTKSLLVIKTSLFISV